MVMDKTFPEVRASQVLARHPWVERGASTLKRATA
jgi:hypothetical protein